VIEDQKHNRACRRHYNAIQIEPCHTNVAENMKDPPADDRAYHSQQHIKDNSLAAMIYKMAGDETRNQTEQNPNE
jgi:hypothetical protein